MASGLLIGGGVIWLIILGLSLTNLFVCNKPWESTGWNILKLLVAIFSAPAYLLQAGVRRWILNDGYCK